MEKFDDYESKGINIDKPAFSPLDSWLDGQEVMQKLHISQRTLQTWRSTGRIGFSKIGRKMYYKVYEIECMLRIGYTRLKGKEEDDGR